VNALLEHYGAEKRHVPLASLYAPIQEQIHKSKRALLHEKVADMSAAGIPSKAQSMSNPNAAMARLQYESELRSEIDDAWGQYGAGTIVKDSFSLVEQSRGEAANISRYMGAQVGQDAARRVGMALGRVGRSLQTPVPSLAK